MTIYYGTVEEDPETGDCIIPIPEEMLEKLGFKEGDKLICQPQEDGTLLIERE